MQPSRGISKPPQPQPLLVVEEVASPAGAEPALGVQTPAGGAPPGYQGPAWSLIPPRMWGEAGGQHGSVSAQPAQARPAGPAQADLPGSVQFGGTGPRGGAQPGRSAAGWAGLPAGQEQVMGQALASAQASAGMTEGCRSTQQGLRPGDQAAGPQPGLGPAGRPARPGGGAVPPPAKVAKPAQPAGRPVGRATTLDASWPPPVLLPSSSTATAQPEATMSVPTQQAAVSNISQAMPGLPPPLPPSTHSRLRHPQTAAFQSAQPNRSLFDHIMQGESNSPHSTLQLQPHPYHQPAPSHGAAALQQQQQQAMPLQRHELLPTQPSGSAAAAQLQQHQTASAGTAEPHQTGLWGGQQPASGHDLEVQAPAHGKARPLQPLGVVEELQQVLLEVRLMGVDVCPCPGRRPSPKNCLIVCSPDMGGSSCTVWNL